MRPAVAHLPRIYSPWLCSLEFVRLLGPKCLLWGSQDYFPRTCHGGWRVVFDEISGLRTQVQLPAERQEKWPSHRTLQRSELAVSQQRQLTCICGEVSEEHSRQGNITKVCRSLGILTEPRLFDLGSHLTHVSVTQDNLCQWVAKDSPAEEFLHF